MDVTASAPPAGEPDKLLRMARNLSDLYAHLVCAKLQAGDVKEALYLAEWQKALEALASGADAGKVNFPASRAVSPPAA